MEQVYHFILMGFSPHAAAAAVQPVEQFLLLPFQGEESSRSLSYSLPMMAIIAGVGKEGIQ